MEANVSEVIVAHRDPFPQVDGGGIARLETAGIRVRTGLLREEALTLNAPYLRLTQQGRPWIHAKWAMTLDGKLAARTGHSQWISCEASRERVHTLRGRMDAIIVGRATATLDDPQLTARPAGPRVAQRIVLDTLASIDLHSQLVASAQDVPTIIVTGPEAPRRKVLTVEDSWLQSVGPRRNQR